MSYFCCVNYSPKKFNTMRQTTTILLFSIFSMLNGQNIVHNSGFEDDLNIFTVIEGSTNVLMRVANIQDATTQTASPTATAIPVAAGLWVKKSPNSGFINPTFQLLCRTQC